MKTSHQVSVSFKTQNKITEDTNIWSRVHELFNNKWSGRVIVHFLLQICQTEIMILLVLISVVSEIDTLKYGCPMANHV